MKSSILLSSLLGLMTCSMAARILIITPFPAKSHHILYSTLIKALVKRGHQVDQYSAFPPSKPLANHTFFHVNTTLAETADMWNYEMFMEMAEADNPSVGSGLTTLLEMGYEVSEETFQNSHIKKLMKSKEHFDLVITEATMGQESLLVFGHKFKAPTITLQGFYSWYAINSVAGNPLSLASIPDCSSVVASDQMSFVERLLNFVSGIITLFRYYNVQLPRHENLIKQHYDQKFPPIKDMVTNISLYLINTHPAIEYVRPYSPNMITIGGMTSSSADRVVLPQVIQKFTDEARDGFIYFSLGTVVPGHVLPDHILQIFVRVFNKSPYRVLWKINLDKINGLSTNVMITKWVPQPGVLAHRNCKLFMTHGGMFSQHESLFAGVPTVGIPFFGDQLVNVHLSEQRGFGVKLNFKTLSEESLQTALDSVLNNPRYKENAKRFSQIFRDRPVSPEDSAMFWIEYVIRHNGAAHLRPASAHMPWYQLSLLDIMAVIVAGLFVVSAILYWILSRILFTLCSSRQQAPITKKKN